MWRRPAALAAGIPEGGIEFVGRPPGLLAGQGLGRLEDRDLVEHLALAQRVLHEMTPGPDVDDDVVQADAEVPDLLDRHRAAVGHVCGADRLVVAQQGADDRAQAVGGKDDLGGVGPAFADRRCAARDLLHPGDLAGRDEIGPDPLGLAEQRGMQVAAVNDDIG